MSIISDNSIYSFIWDSSIKAICFEAGSTIHQKSYYSVQHPKCYKYFNKVFGYEWNRLLGAHLVSYGSAAWDFIPEIVPVGFRFRKLLLAAVLKPPVYSPEYRIDPSVKGFSKERIYPGYLCETKEEYVKNLTSRLPVLADELKLEKVLVAPFSRSCFILDKKKVAKYMIDNLDDRFVIALEGF